MAGGQEGQENTGHLQGLHVASDAHRQPGWGQERRPEGRAAASGVLSRPLQQWLAGGTSLERGQREERVLGLRPGRFQGQHVRGNPGAVFLLKTEAPVLGLGEAEPWEPTARQAPPRPQPGVSGPAPPPCPPRPPQPGAWCATPRRGGPPGLRAQPPREAGARVGGEAGAGAGTGAGVEVAEAPHPNAGPALPRAATWGQARTFPPAPRSVRQL